MNGSKLPEDGVPLEVIARLGALAEAHPQLAAEALQMARAAVEYRHAERSRETTLMYFRLAFYTVIVLTIIVAAGPLIGSGHDAGGTALGISDVAGAASVLIHGPQVARNAVKATSATPALEAG